MISTIILLLGVSMAGVAGSVFIVALKELDEIDEISGHSSGEINSLS